MDTKKRNIIIIVLVLVVVLFGIYHLLNPKIEDNSGVVDIETSQGVEEQSQNDSGESPVLDSKNQVDLNIKVSEQEASKQKLEATVKSMALSFTERIGSYSNQSNFQNIIELKPFMTEKMLSWADNFIAQQEGGDVSEYFGVTTRVLSTQILEVDDLVGEALVELNTQKIESEGQNRDNKVKYQKARVSLLKVDGKWMIDDLKWL